MDRSGSASTRRSLAMKLGGRWLLQVFLRGFPTIYKPFYRQTHEQVIQRRLSESEFNEFADEPLSEIMSKPAKDLSKAERMYLREAFYDKANMTVPALRRWLYDPRLNDGVDRARPYWRVQARAHLRALIFLRSTTRKDGAGWIDSDYDTARRSIFVIENLFHPRHVDYQTWAVLQIYGRDWGRPTLYEPGRRLPLFVQMEAEMARLKLRFSGRPEIGQQL